MINTKIIKLASDTINEGLKNISTHKSSMKNKNCGDKIEIEIVAKNNQIKSFRYVTKSCVYSNASASILSKKIRLFSIDSLEKDIDIFYSILKDSNINLPKKYNCFKDLINTENKARKDCITLPFDALLKALKI